MSKKSKTLITVETSRTVTLRQASPQDGGLVQSSSVERHGASRGMSSGTVVPVMNINSDLINQWLDAESLLGTKEQNSQYPAKAVLHGAVPSEMADMAEVKAIRDVCDDAVERNSKPVELRETESQQPRLILVPIAASTSKATSDRINPPNLNDLLDWLSEDREQAGLKYEEIRKTLIKTFIYKGSRWPEELADLTIDRVIRKLPDIKDQYKGRPVDYFCGVAKNILLEHQRKSGPVVILPVYPRFEEEEHEHLERCLAKLSDQDRFIILEYYTGDAKEKIIRRQDLAKRLGIPMNALRIRAHRIRTNLHRLMINDPIK